MKRTDMIRLIGTACVWLGLALSQAARADERFIHVAPDGNDAWTGATASPNAEQSDGPVATPARASELVRALKAQPGTGPIHVLLRGGTYVLERPLVLTAADSGTAKSPVVWSAYPDEKPVLSGGQRLSGWTKTTVNGRNAWVAGLGGDPKSPTIRELWLDGKRLGRARFPKTGTLALEGLSGQKLNDWTKGATEFRYSGDDLKPWPAAGDGEVILATKWVESHVPITAIDAVNHVVRFSKRTVFAPEVGDRYWVENVKANLTEPGEFYVDPRERTVTLIAPLGVDPNAASVVAPRLAQVLRLAGRPAAGEFVENLSFRGLSFEYAEWYFGRDANGDERPSRPDPTSSGFDQAAIGVSAAVSGRGVRDCAFERCTVAHTGTYGIELSQGCRNNRITHCTLTDLGAGGVKIGEVTVRDGADRQTTGNVVSDCTITDGGNLFPSCVAVWIGQSPGNTVAHNDIHGFWYTAVSIGWTWGYARSTAQRNILESNHIHHIGCKADGDQPILSDMGCVYTLGDQEGTVIRGNHFHDVAGKNYGGWGIYFDEGTTHILAENNLVYRTTHGGFHQHYGKENTVRNNIFAFGRDAQIQRSRVEDHLSFTFQNNLVLWDKGPLLAGDWNKLDVAFDGNTYWRGDGAPIRFGNLSWEQWRSEGQDAHAKIADPHLMDPARGNFQPTAQSPPAFAGFQPFDVSKWSK